MLLHSCISFSHRQNGSICSGLLLLMAYLWSREMHTSQSRGWEAFGGPDMYKTAHKHLLHRVVDLCCGLGPIGLLIRFMAGRGCSGGYLNPPPSTPTPPPAHSSPYMYDSSSFQSLKNLYTENQNKSNLPLICLLTESQ